MAAYLISGHGSERLVEFSKRPRIPPGITLVTLAKCGEATDMESDVRFLEAFQDHANKDLFLHPQEHRAQLNDMLSNEIHIYNVGDAYPILTTN